MEASSSFIVGQKGSWEHLRSGLDHLKTKMLMVMGAHRVFYFKPAMVNEETLPPVLGKRESQLTMQTNVLEPQSERFLEVCHGKGAHGVNLCHLTWDSFCLILDNYSTDIFI